MEYYLETNALYKIRQIPAAILTESFYSALSLVELIGGLIPANFTKRRALLSQVIASDATFYSYFPEDVIIAGFNYFKNNNSLKDRYKISRIKGENLIELADEIIKSDCYEEFVQLSSSKFKKYPFEYFQKLDEYYSVHFCNTTAIGNLEISGILKEANRQKITLPLGDKKYDLSSRKAIEKFFDDLPFINLGITILAHATDAMKNLSEKQNETIEKEIFESYNGTVDIYINAFSKYTAAKTVSGSTPKKNDLQDLLHLCYLRNSEKILLISEDKIFRNYIPEQVFSIEQLIGKAV